VTSAEELLELADTIGPHLCILKTHIDILDDFTPDVTKKLQKLANEHQFVIFEDRKFADIGNTVMQQYEGGVYKISDWAPLTNAHPLPGPGIIEGLQKVGQPKGNGLLLLANLSSAGNLIDEDYTKKTVELAYRYPEFVVGFICQKRLTDDPSFLHLTPGIQKQSKGDALGQQYNTPEYAIIERGTDVIIVGRGIIHDPNPKLAAQEYQALGWDAYQLRQKSVCV
jgi:uridine monophosphate synthetase